MTSLLSRLRQLADDHHLPLRCCKPASGRAPVPGAARQHRRQRGPGRVLDAV